MKEFWKYYLKGAMIGNISTIAIAIIGGFIHRKGWVKNEMIRESVEWYNEMTVLGWKMIWEEIKKVAE